MILIRLEFKNAEMNITGVLLALKLIALNCFSNWTNTCFKKKKGKKTGMVLSSVKCLQEIVVPPVPNNSYLKV